jgi:hypothetical protein
VHRTLLLLPLLAAPLRAADPPAGPTLIARPDAFQTLVNPQCSHCRDEAERRTADLRADDRVLCWVRGYSDGGAIPLRFFLATYRVISDSYGVFVYDPDAGYARGFAPSYDFRFYGWRNGVMVMRHKDGTLYSCLTGLAFDGPKKGERLRPVPTLASDWGFWLRRYPHNVAYHMSEKYRPVGLSARVNEDSARTRGRADPRLPEDAAVLGVAVGDAARAYPLAAVEKAGLVRDQLGGRDVLVLWYGPTRTAAAYRPLAMPSKEGAERPRPVTLARDDKDADAPFADRETGSRWDIAGRAVAGPLTGWTLEWLDGTQVKWCAWAAEYPHTTVHGQTPSPTTGKAPSEDKAKEVAGDAEFLRAVPKHFARLESIDAAHRRITLLIDGEKQSREWPLMPDAEVKVAGWWGRPEQLRPGDRVWAWFLLDRRTQPVSIFMLADEPSEQDIHGAGLTVSARDADAITLKAGTGKARSLSATGAVFNPVQASGGPADAGAQAHTPVPAEALRPGAKVFVQSAGGRARLVFDAAGFEAARTRQRAWLAGRWSAEGLPGSVSVLHPLSGEMEVLLDHEAMRWGRSLKPGDEVRLRAEPPIRAVVKRVTPWRERTQVRLVVHGHDQADLAFGQRMALLTTAPSGEMEEALLPPDTDRPRNREERVDWLLASVYCPCGVGGDTCTGHFYTLASCNPNGCGMPNLMRKRVATLMEKGRTDRQIVEELIGEYGASLLRPHLAP